MTKCAAKIFISIVFFMAIAFAIFYGAQKNLFFKEQRFFIEKNTASATRQQNISGSSAAKTIFKPASASKLKSAENGRTNILILGVPGEGNNAPELTDTIMIFSVYPDSKTASLVSLPRDLYVQIPGSQYYSKINYLNLKGERDGIGQNLIIQAVEEISGQTMDYYFLTDLKAIKITVDELGGINVPLSGDINDLNFPTENFGHEQFEIDKGWRFLSGEESLKYIRTRAFMLGDFERMKNQQIFFEALRKKLFGLNLFGDFSKLISIYKKISEGKHIKTNMRISDFETLHKILSEIKRENINFSVIDGNTTNLVKTSTVQIGKDTTSIVIPKAGIGDYEEIKIFFKKLDPKKQSEVAR